MSGCCCCNWRRRCSWRWACGTCCQCCSPWERNYPCAHSPCCFPSCPCAGKRPCTLERGQTCNGRWSKGRLCKPAAVGPIGALLALPHLVACPGLPHRGRGQGQVAIRFRCCIPLPNSSLTPNHTSPSNPRTVCTIVNKPISANYTRFSKLSRKGCQTTDTARAVVTHLPVASGMPPPPPLPLPPPPAGAVRVPKLEKMSSSSSSRCCSTFCDTACVLRSFCKTASSCPPATAASPRAVSPAPAPAAAPAPALIDQGVPLLDLYASCRS